MARIVAMPRNTGATPPRRPKTTSPGEWWTEGLGRQLGRA